jgi:hypothetical protein
MEVPEENIGKYLTLSSGHAERFSNCEESPRHLKESVLKFHCIKLKIFTWEKIPSESIIKRQMANMGESICSIDH